MAKRPAAVRDGDERRRVTRQPGRSGQRGAPRRPDAAVRRRRPTPDQRPARSAPQTGPIPRPGTRAAVATPKRPKNAGQAKARAKARKAKAPKVVRPPLRERLVARLASVELNPRTLLTRVPFVVLVIGSLGMGLGITLWLSTGAAERSYQLGHARSANQDLQQQKEALERDVLEAQAAPALAESARNLGMIPSRDTAHLVQDATGNWVVVGTPKPAEGVPPPPLNTPLPEDTPAPPPPAAPRVVDPREMAVRIPARTGQAHLPGQQAQPGQPVLPGQAPLPGQTPIPGQLAQTLPPGTPAVAAPGAEVPHGVPSQQAMPGPAAPQPQAPLQQPTAPEVPVPAQAPATPQDQQVPQQLAAPQQVPAAPVPAVPTLPGPPPGAEQTGPVIAPVPGAPA